MGKNLKKYLGRICVEDIDGKVYLCLGQNAGVEDRVEINSAIAKMFLKTKVYVLQLDSNPDGSEPTTAFKAGIPSQRGSSERVDNPEVVKPSKKTFRQKVGL